MAADRAELIHLIAVLAAYFNLEADMGMLHEYDIGLRDLPLPDVEYAISRAIRELRHMPSAAELRGFAARRENVKLLTDAAAAVGRKVN